MKKIKLIYLVSTLKRSGPLQIVFGLIKGIDHSRYEISVVTLSTEKSYSMKSVFEASGCVVHRLENSRLEGLIKNRKKIQLLINALKADIVHSHGFRADLINARLTGVCRFSTIHNFPGEDYPLKFGRYKGKFMEVAHKKAFQRIENLIACSTHLQSKLSRSYGIPAHCVQNGIETNLYQQVHPDEKVDLRKQLNLPLNKNIFLVSGSLIERKDPTTIIKAFQQLDQDQNLLVFIGSGELEHRLRSTYSKRNILFKGAVTNVLDYLRTCDYYISASLSEGLPNSVLEAMSCDLPVVLSDIPSHLEIVGKDYPLLFPRKDDIALKQKLLQMIHLQESNISNSLCKLVQSNFNATNMSFAYQNLYLTLCQHLEK